MSLVANDTLGIVEQDLSPTYADSISPFFLREECSECALLHALFTENEKKKVYIPIYS